jgi:YD repeat-containing protein
MGGPSRRTSVFALLFGDREEITSVTDALGDVAYFTYDGAGNLLTQKGFSRNFRAGQGALCGETVTAAAIYGRTRQRKRLNFARANSIAACRGDGGLACFCRGACALRAETARLDS